MRIFSFKSVINIFHHFFFASLSFSLSRSESRYTQQDSGKKKKTKIVEKKKTKTHFFFLAGG